MAARKFSLPGPGLRRTLLALILRRRAAVPRHVEVGVDGVLHGERFVPYTEIGQVEHARIERMVPRRVRGGEVQEIWRAWAVTLRLGVERKGGILLAGERIEIVTRERRLDEGDPLGAEIARAIEEARAAAVEAQRGRDVEVDVSRSGRTGAEWVEALRRRGAGASDSYRRLAADVDKLSRLLDDPHEKPSARAAAAILLAASGDETAATRLRVAAEAMVDPRVRLALENVAGEAGVAEALEALEEAERARGGRSVP